MVYQNYWQKLERRLTSGKNVDIQSFFHDYLVSILGKSIATNNEYKEFEKHYVNSLNINAKWIPQVFVKNLITFILS